MAALGINDQEIANGLGVDPEVLAELKASFTEGPNLTVGNVFTGWWGNNWTEIDDKDR